MNKVKAPAKFDYNSAAPFDRLVEALREIAGGKICKPGLGATGYDDCEGLEFGLRAIAEREGMDPAAAQLEGGLRLSEKGLAWFGLTHGLWFSNAIGTRLGWKEWRDLLDYIAERERELAWAWAEAQERGI